MIIPLRLHSEYSIEDGMVRLQDAVDFAKKKHIPALALTDLMNMFGVIKFYQKCRKNGIKPIFGVDFYLENEKNIKEPTQLLLLAKNHAGYLQLCELLTKAYLSDEPYVDKVYIKWLWLEELAKGHLICLSGGRRGEIGQFILSGKLVEATEKANSLSQLFPESFYLEIQKFKKTDHYQKTDNKAQYLLQKEVEEVLRASLSIADTLNLPLVATHPIEFLTPDDFMAHEARVCIASGQVLSNEKRPHDFHPSQYFLSPEEMAELFSDLPDALENTNKIAQRCNVSLILGKNFLPDFATPNNISLDEYLCLEAEKGLEERLIILFPDPNQRKEMRLDYEKRLKFELDTIIQMGFPGYFLIVADFINWAKNNGCPVGPGRGSGAGSLVAYSLKITDLDPLAYNLLFERFLNPERISMPDFDIDFCQENRGRVIDYVRQKYGEAAVSQIITFGTLSSKAVIRDVGRVLGLPFGLCDRLSKLIPAEANRPVSLSRAMELEPQIKKIIKDEEADELIHLSLKLEDLTRGSGMHAGGVLIAPGKLTDFCPVYKSIGADTVSVSMYDKDDVEKVGLVKFDFLGLRNLTILHLAEELIEKNRQLKIDISSIPLDDVPTYKIFQNANTTAVFQFESSGMKRMLKEAKPSKFEELIAFVALYRPGPMDLIPDFIKRMHGTSFEYLHPLLEPVLKPTYGIMVYQEQVMQAAQICGGYSLGGADLLRRVMGKKKVEEMNQQRAFFVAGADKKGIDQDNANQIFDYMEKFAGYGFNKSHAAAYALIAYQTAWLKAHYLVEFISATMSSELDNTDQLKVFFDDAIENKIKFLPPCVNHSYYQFVPAGEFKIKYALGALKGTGEAAVNAIVEEREKNGYFLNLFDFCARLDKQVVNKRVLESLIRGGAFDELENNRAILLENVDLALDYATQRSANQFQDGLFDLDVDIIDSVTLKQVKPWDLKTKLFEEKQAIGFYFSAHPFEPYQSVFGSFVRSDLKTLKISDNHQWIAGFVTSIRSIITKNGKKIWIVLLEDLGFKREVVIREEVLDKSEFILKSDEVYLFKVKVSNNDFGNGDGLRINADILYSIDGFRTFFSRKIKFQLNQNSPIEVFKNILLKYRQGTRKIPVEIEYQNQFAKAKLISKAEWSIQINQELLDEMNDVLGTENIELYF